MTSNYDAIVVGGGIIGCSVAWRLAQGGRRVALLERGRVGGEASSAAGGLLCPKAGPDTPDSLLRFWLTSLQMYSSFVDEVKSVTGHNFELRIAGQLAVAFSDAEVAELRSSFVLQKPAGVNAHWLSGADALAAEPQLAPDVQAAIHLPDHILLDNGRLTQAVGAAVRRTGGDVLEYRHVIGLALDGRRVVGVETSTGLLGGDVVVNCAGSWAGGLDPRAKQPIRPMKGQMLAVDARPFFFEYVIQGPGGGFVPRADGRTLIGATQDDVGFDKDVLAGSISALFERTARIVPVLRQARLLDAWAGLRPMAPDHLPVVGPDPELAGLYWATGHYTMGILLAPATARAVADVIESGKSTIPIDAFSVGRFAASTRV